MGDAMSKKLSTQFENNRQTILATTSKLFCDNGINATSFSDLSRAVKLSKGTIYYYYPSKDHLILEVTDYHLSQVTDSIIAWIENISENITLESAVLLLLQSIFDTVDKCRLHICLLNYAIMGNDIIKNLFKEKAAQWQTMVKVGFVKTGHPNPKQVTAAVFMALDSIVIKRVMGQMDVDEKHISVHISQYV
jgi:AcrR family transcriptional regulator